MTNVSIKLPQVLRIEAEENGNSIYQLGAPAWQGSAQVTSFREGKVDGFIIKRPKHPDVLLITNSAKPPASFTHVLRLKDDSLRVKKGTGTDLLSGAWEIHPLRLQPLTGIAAFEANTIRVRDSWLDAFTYRREDSSNNRPGLRPPQIGSIYAVQSHWTVHSEPGTIVLPTGVGKTETMLSLLVAERCERLMVVVPTDALRVQISDKFLTLGLLKEFGVVSTTAEYPVVGILNHRPTVPNEAELFFRKCNVVITTMPLANQCSEKVMQRMASLSSCLFIDEAHHVAAPKWKEFKDAFNKSRIVQFTATPFRNDDKPIGGKRLFTFSLRHAQEQGYFKPIAFTPVLEFEKAKKDEAIVQAAIAQLRKDEKLGHILMARVGTISRAEGVFELYKKYKDFKPIQLHTGIGKRERDNARSQLLSGQSRIVVCVDMLGEGFDLPELKIAAFHDIRKSLAVTLQLAGRFTRTKPKLGNATFIANVADLDVKDELKKLYRHDSDWNALLPHFSETASTGDVKLADFLRGFTDLPDEISLQLVRPKMSTVVYKTKCKSWTPEDFSKGITGFDSFDKVYHTLNAHGNTLVVVTAKRVSVEWAQMDEIHNWDWQLYVVHWDQKQNLLFINNSSNSGFFKRLAEAVAGNVTQITGKEVFRSMAGIGRLTLYNVGLREQLGKMIRFTMRAGSDVARGLSEAQKGKAVKSNVFGQGFEGGHRTSIGCSQRGRIWSYKTTNIFELTNWSRAIGKKLLDSSLKHDEVLKGTLIPHYINKRPDKYPIAIEWPEIFFKEPEQAFTFRIGKKDIPQCDADIKLVNPSKDGPLSFEIASEDTSVTFVLELSGDEDSPDYRFVSKSKADTAMHIRNSAYDLAEFLYENPPTIWFVDGSSLSGIEYVELPTKPNPFPASRVEEWKWSGTNIRAESQGVSKKKDSIQFRVIKELKKRKLKFIYDDDGSGESADVVAVTENDKTLEVEFWHCKYSGGDNAGKRIDDLYEVCGQAQKCIRWMDKPRDLFTHLLRREPRKQKGKQATRYEVGTSDDLLRIREKVDTHRVNLSVVIVQPGISKAQASREQLELIAVTEKYLLETFAVTLRVITSE